MSYLHFDKTLMTNLEESLQKEILRTNSSGAYHCTTIVNCNTRKYHGLLVMPVPEIDDENHVLLSLLDETVIQHGASFNLGLHRYQGGNYDPKGHKYIRDYSWEKVPTTLYRVGGVILKKEKLFVHYENRILIRYTLVEAQAPIRLRLQPFLAFRSVHKFTHENPQASREYRNVENGIETCMYAGYPHLYMQLSKANDFVFRPDWYRNLEYVKERERGYDFTEDLYVPGYFETEMQRGETVIFSGGITETETQKLENVFGQEIDARIPRNSFHNCLVCSAHQFLNRQGGEHYILAGYPWFRCRARDLFIALPGLTLATGEQDRFEAVMATARKAAMLFINDNPSGLGISEMQHPDVLLWCVWCLQQYANMVGTAQCKERYGDLLSAIMHFICRNQHPNLFFHDNGLLFTNGKERAVTWMNSSVNGRPVVPRSGYVVEINALWYNALCFTASLLSGDTAFAEQLLQIAQRAKQSFVGTFMNEHGYLFDYVDESMAKDWSVRPNMIFACAFDYSPLGVMQMKDIVQIVTRELLTPKGLRSLSPKSSGYNPIYAGSPLQRDHAYHQGTAWPWLAGFYFEAYLKLYKMGGVGFVERQLIGYEDEMTQSCIGSMPELFDGNPPFTGRGAVSFAMNVAEILRTTYILNQFTNE